MDSRHAPSLPGVVAQQEAPRDHAKYKRVLRGCTQRWAATGRQYCMENVNRSVGHRPRTHQHAADRGNLRRQHHILCEREPSLWRPNPLCGASGRGTGTGHPTTQPPSNPTTQPSNTRHPTTNRATRRCRDNNGCGHGNQCICAGRQRRCCCLAASFGQREVGLPGSHLHHCSSFGRFIEMGPLENINSDLHNACT